MITASAQFNPGVVDAAAIATDAVDTAEIKANAVLDGKQEQQLFSAPAPSLEDEAVAIAVAAEAASLFTGNY